MTTNVASPRERLLDDDGKPFFSSERSKELYKYILRHWCRPAGLCYNPMAGPMTIGLAAYEIGLRYIAAEEDEKCFSAAEKRILRALSRPIKRTRKQEERSDIFKKSYLKADQGIKINNEMRTDSHAKLPESAVGNEADVPKGNSDKNSVSLSNGSSKKHGYGDPEFFPDRQPIDEDTTDSESAEAGNRSGCAAGKSCKNVLNSAPPAHTCDICGALVHNLCEYGKRVMKDYSREGIFACSSACYCREKSSG